MEVSLESPAAAVHVGDPLEIVAHVRLRGGARGPWMLAPTSDGYVAVALPTLWQLDADGRRVRSQALTLDALGAGDLGDVSVSVAGQRVSLAFTLVTSAGVSVWSAAECLP